MTLKRYKAVVTTFISWVTRKYPATKTMKQIRTEHAEAYAHHLEQRNLSPSSFNIYFNSLSTVWAVLARKSNLTSNPFVWDKATRTGIQRKNIKAETSRRKKRPLTLQEITDAIETAKGSYKTLLILLTFTGQRLVDCVKMKWKSINLQQRVITLIPQKTARRTGKEVIIPILPELEAELSSINRRSEYVLPDLVEIYNRNPPAITKKIRSILTSAGINATRDTDFKTIKAVAETGSQSFRHSFVSFARMHNIPDGVIQTITGHESIELINHYTTITINDIEALSASLPTLGSKTKCQFSARVVPSWIKEILRGMTVDNWEIIKEQLIKE